MVRERFVWAFLLRGLFVAAVVCCLVVPAVADPCPLITVNENGIGTLDFSVCAGGGFKIPMPGVLAPDPGPGGLPAVLTYNLLGPPSLVAGDVLMTDAGVLLDVVRFNPAGTGGNPAYPASLLFYSDNVPVPDSLGDTPGPPGVFYANQVVIPEVGTEANNGAIYTPLAGQPGFVAGFNVTYDLVSDGVFPVPEPTWVGLPVFLVLMLVEIRRRQRQRA
jgi:hypothetical protein